jgi:dTDP-4-amino-4,6-dideoxygalactose transaminase
MSKLAITGGEKAINRPLGKRWPIWDEKEEKALLETLNSGRWWGGGEGSKVWEFENAFASYHDAKYGIATSSGTQSLLNALKGANVESEDEVLTPALTFFASATCILMLNAIPVFVDVDPNSYNMDAKAMESAITKDTKAAIVVHNGGYPADMDAIMSVAKKHNIKVIEDCAHAHGSEWKGTKIGAIGHLGAFSLMAGKSIAGGEGGIVLTNHEDLRANMYAYMDMGRWTERPDKNIRLPMTSNFRMPEFTAAVLLCQLSRFDEQVATRERNFTYLAERLKDIDGIDAFERDPRVTRWSIYYWNFKFNQDKFDGISRDKFLQAINAEGVPMGLGAHGAPVYRNPLFQSITNNNTYPIKVSKSLDYTKVNCPEAERIFRTESLSISHPIFLGELEEMDLIADAIKKVRSNTDELR